MRPRYHFGILACILTEMIITKISPEISGASSVQNVETQAIRTEEKQSNQ